MPKKTYKPEEIIGKLREAEVRLSQGASVAEVLRALQISEVTYYRWRKEYGGMRVEQAKRLKEVERENARLRKVVADLTLDKLIPGRRPRETSEPRTPSTLRHCGGRAFRGIRETGM